MKWRDRFLVAVRNIVINKPMVKKMIFGMVFVIMILFCVLIIISSYSEYIFRFNEKHSKDCYYYKEVEQQEISVSGTNDLIKQVESEKEQYNAENVSVLCTLKIQGGIQLLAGNTRVGIDNRIYEGDNYFVNNRAIYQNIHGKNSPIEMALYKDEFFVFADIITATYDGNWLVGKYPQQPGEIMMDTHILEVFGVEKPEALIGSEISIIYYDQENEREVISKYNLTGVFKGDILKVRESLMTTDNHLEHIYINLRAEDEKNFVIGHGSKRFYFSDYKKYIKNYEGMDEILKLNLQNKYAIDNQGVQLTGKGMECCILYWILEHIGKLLMFVAIAVCLIITISVMYIYRFYREQSKNYITMLRNIGMQNKDVIWIFFLELFTMVIFATLCAIYLSVIFMLFFNAVIQQVIDFKIVFNLRVCIISLLISWCYFYVCFYITMKKCY